MQTKRRYTNKNRGKVIKEKRVKRGKKRCRTMKGGASKEVCDELSNVDSGLLQVFRSSVQLPKIMLQS
jgi:hypothetical protein